MFFLKKNFFNYLNYFQKKYNKKNIYFINYLSELKIFLFFVLYNFLVQKA